MNHPGNDNDEQASLSMYELPNASDSIGIRHDNASHSNGMRHDNKDEGRTRKNSMSDTSIDMASFDDIFTPDARHDNFLSDDADEQSSLISRQDHNHHETPDSGNFGNVFEGAIHEGPADNGFNQARETPTNATLSQNRETQENETKEHGNREAFDSAFNNESDQKSQRTAEMQQSPEPIKSHTRDGAESPFSMGSMNTEVHSSDKANGYAEQHNSATTTQEEGKHPVENDFHYSHPQEVTSQGSYSQFSQHDHENGSSSKSLGAQTIGPNSRPENLHYSSALEPRSTTAASTYHMQAAPTVPKGNERIPQETRASGNGSRSPVERVIELLDDEGDTDSDDTRADPSKKRQRLDQVGSNNVGRHQSDAAAASASARNMNMPRWMTQNSQSQGFRQRQAVPIQRPTIATTPAPSFIQSRPRIQEPSYFDLPPGFVPTWELLYPIRSAKKQEPKAFELSLLNVQEFTITGLPVTYEGPPSSVTGLRLKIKEISKPHGKAVFEKDKEGYGGKWRIPLGAYRSFFSYLNSDPMVRVVGIPETQLKIASLGKARLERGYPSTRKIISKGVPKGLAKALAPFQRGGVDFVAEKDGRALIADDMGLGKTIQAIASLTMYHEEWPVLVLTPSTARYHWESEFQQWLGIDSPVNKDDYNAGADFVSDDDGSTSSDNGTNYHQHKPMPLLKDSQIHVLTSSKDDIMPNTSTRVVICSYGLAPALVESGKIFPSLFRCAIVDESHMLKNIATKRTSRLVPILHATDRCVLLSGTPALARPSELFPQLKILSTEKDAWWEDEGSFVDKYVKRSSPARRAELYAMLTGTVMIRRLKGDILKSMPNKIREKAVSDVSTPAQRKEFYKCMSLLREGKGVMGKLARQHSALDSTNDSMVTESDDLPSNGLANKKREDAKLALDHEYHRRYKERSSALHYSLATTVHQLNADEQMQFIQQQDSELRRELDVWYKERLHELDEEELQLQSPELTRKSALNRMYTLTAKSKVPLIADMITRWLQDPTKGKLCVFAHHIFVLDDLIKLVGLSNTAGSDRKYIRIDGTTSPKTRQSQIKAFQTDPDVKIAILGITAAGVAVTLTASSTVWFAELFWTPALMIQAEDRCHRIGQNSQVRCLYFCAIGTLDELLWKLLEKKFRDLGEFVEGKEKMKIVVQKTYTGKKDLLSMFNVDEDPSGDASNSENTDDDSSDEGDVMFDLDGDLAGEISMLGKEELTMMLPEGDEDDVDPETKGVLLSQSQPKKVGGAGASEEDAILLSDDEDAKPSAAASATVSRSATPPAEAQAAAEQATHSTNQFQSCRFYNLIFDGPSFGMQLKLHKGRAIVSRKIDTSQEKPAIGDILVAANGLTLPLIADIDAITTPLRAFMVRGSVELTFAEHEAFSRYFQAHEAEAARLMLAEHLARQNRYRQGPDEVIELLDDD